jgi:hypothetical protein
MAFSSPGMLQGTETHRSIQTPTADLPWSMDVVSLLPESILAEDSYYFSGAARLRWNCLVLSTELKVWYAPPKTTLGDQKLSLPTLSLVHPKLAYDKTIVKLHTDPQSPRIVFVYAVNRDNGDFLVWQLDARSLTQRQQPATYTSIPLQDGDSISTFQVAAGQAPRLWVGTSHGHVYWMSQTTIPMSVHAQLVQEEKKPSFFPLWTSSSSSSTLPPSEAVVAVCPCTDRTFLVAFADGSVLEWTMNQTESRRVLFECREVFQLLPVYQSQESANEISMLKVIQAAYQGNSLHMLFLVVSDHENSRLYWARFLDGKLQVMQRLNRFVDPAQEAQVAGLEVADNNVAYTIVSTHVDPGRVRLGVGQAGRTTVVLALSGDRVHELDVHIPGTVATILPETLTKDWVKYGIIVWDATGIGLRFTLRDDTIKSSSPGGNRIQSKTLQMHLKAAFWENYSHPDQVPRLPPSLLDASVGDLEQAVISFSRQLLQEQREVITSPSRPVELHLALVEFLQQTARYRDLSALCRWQLFAMGQEASALQAIASKQTIGWERDQIKELKAGRVAEWLEELQEICLTGGGQDRQESFMRWCCEGIDAALAFRAEHANATYDIPPNLLPQVQSLTDVPVWTSHPSIQNILKRQVLFWGSHSVVSSNFAQSIVQFWLQTCLDNLMAFPDDGTRSSYTEALKEAFSLLRRISTWKNDLFLFELCVTYIYIDGICEIVYDHEQRGDGASFALEPLFEANAAQVDKTTNLSFGLGVLKWFIDRRLFGHALRYGKYCPDALAHWMTNETALAPYKWIHDIGNKNYSSATASLLQKINGGNAPLLDTLNTLSAANLSNRIVMMESLVQADESMKLHRNIEKKRELVMAQKELIGDTENPLQPPHRLLQLALQKVDQFTDSADKAHACMIGLAIATAFESNSEMEEKAMSVWCKSIVSNEAAWQRLLNQQVDISDSTLREKLFADTVFCQLLELVDDDQSEDLERISFRNLRIENMVLGSLDPSGSDIAPKMQRLLRSAAGIESSI